MAPPPQQNHLALIRLATFKMTFFIFVPPFLTDDDDDDDDDDLESTANRVPMSDTTFSTLGIIFGLVNLALVIIFILIGIYASKKEAPTKYREKVQRSVSGTLVVEYPGTCVSIND